MTFAINLDRELLSSMQRDISVDPWIRLLRFLLFWNPCWRSLLKFFQQKITLRLIRTPKSGHESVRFLILLNYYHMSKRIFTKEQINEMLKNTNVSYCSGRSITYTKDFKLLTIKLHKQGLTSYEIFRKAGFNLNIVGRHHPKDCLRRWLKLFRAKGEDGLSDYRGKTGRGGRPKTKGVTETDKIKRLEAEVAYLKMENDFLAKLRARRAESNSGRSKNTPS